jgi:endonuclease G
MPVLLLSYLAATAIAFAGQTSCPEHYAQGQAPEIVNQKMTAKTREICYSGYGSMHSGVTRTPLYSAEHLTRDRLLQGKGLKRQSKFFPEPSIPASERAELYHYARSGFDRGHVAPSADMFDLQSQQECFSLANIVPQVPENNRGPWEGIESAVRKMAKDRGDIYVVTGPIFQGSNLQRIGGAVLVPTQLFKAVLDPARQEAGAYLIDNTIDARPQKITVAELEKIAGFDVFPSVTQQVKQKGMNLPDPKERKRKRGR